ncbi:hypothetical protein [Halorubellus sp. PRR65]|uniref:hypothetical protein n=1 Tax=Halorubellus sp. PRR65 TaxID=3098148 RepID=UPI002B25EB5E|nr:hypothetical protein [Halorubellus sp. PRR65]
MSDEHQTTESRRSVLKKSAVAASAAVGGLAGTASAASAETGATAAADGNITVRGYGDFKVIVEAEWVDVENGCGADISESGDYVTIEGTVNGYPNTPGDDGAYYTIQGYGNFHTSTSDSDVELDVNVY